MGSEMCIRDSIDNDRAIHWLRYGAKPTERVEKLLRISGAWEEFTGKPLEPIKYKTKDEASVEEPVAEEAPAEDEASVEEPVAEEAPADDEASVEEPVAEEAPADDEASVEEPVAEEDESEKS